MSRVRSAWRVIRRVWAVVGSVALVGFIGWSYIAFRATDEAVAALASDTRVSVARGDGYWSFQRAGGKPAETGLLFFAGSMVDPVAYAPIARAAALAGFPVLLVELPYRGVFGGADGGEVIARGRSAQQQTPGVSKWVVAGHSRGGEVATRFVFHGAPGLAGLVLVGTSHPRDFSLADTKLKVTKVLGTNDGISPLEKSEKNRHLLPATTRWVVIEGGNHSQFGWYRFQPGDHFASIGRDQQQAQAIAAIIDALQSAAH
ncbi:alpha/beta hydrolase [Usitatibacter palustris]|uniref:Alpha/beta hydrolase fold-5 domain-containing protein n=1 Tax=Usitatibacter palustris TaxID=2732487 RepID=A0A6M4H7L2_9PROT|nr:alpha/beta hydrolase [Usitatibacter palustris]QJR14878.1 hypothetical protein DSM104440_01693 [Usitatibacter palustris]